MVRLCPGVQQHGTSVTAGAESHNLRVPSGAQGPAGGQGDQEREPGQLQHERQELEDRVPGDVSGGQLCVLSLRTLRVFLFFLCFFYVFFKPTFVGFCSCFIFREAAGLIPDVHVCGYDRLK